MDIKTMIVQRVIDTAGNVIAGQLSKSDWEARRANITQYYKDLGPIRETLPDAPDVREIPEQRGGKEKTNEIVNQICTDLSPSERSECEEAVKEFMENPSVMDKYLKSFARG